MGAGVSALSYGERVRRTWEFVKARDCPVCIAKVGELCYTQVTNRSAPLGWQIVRSISNTHLARMAGSITGS